MGLSTYTEVFEYAKQHHIAIGGFNCLNMEMMQAIVGAANEMNSPIIAQTYFAHIDLAGADYMSALCHTAAANSQVKVALGLDHGQNLDQAKLCIESGYSGVMIDLSSEDFDLNVKETSKVVEIAHANNVSVEAEIGKIFNADCTVKEIATGYTDPDVARRFVEETNVDCLAVSIGTAHGIYKYNPQINFELLEELVETIPCPIVVHGGSGTPDEDVLKMVKIGISKLNVGTDFFNEYKRTIYETFQQNGLDVPIEQIVMVAREAVKQKAIEKIGLLTKYRV